MKMNCSKKLSKTSKLKAPALSPKLFKFFLKLSNNCPLPWPNAKLFLLKLKLSPKWLKLSDPLEPIFSTLAKTSLLTESKSIKTFLPLSLTSNPNSGKILEKNWEMPCSKSSSDKPLLNYTTKDSTSRHSNRSSKESSKPSIPISALTLVYTTSSMKPNCLNKLSKTLKPKLLKA